MSQGEKDYQGLNFDNLMLKKARYKFNYKPRLFRIVQ